MFAFRGFEANCVLNFCVCRRAIAKIKCQGGLLIECYLHVTVTKNGQSKREQAVLFGECRTWPLHIQMNVDPCCSILSGVPGNGSTIFRRECCRVLSFLPCARFASFQGSGYYLVDLFHHVRRQSGFVGCGELVGGLEIASETHGSL